MKFESESITLSFFCHAFVLAVTVMLGSLLGLAQEQPSAQQEPIRVDVNLITLRFSVTNDQGNPVNDLSQENFRVRENGIEREVVYFQPPRNRGGASTRLRLAFLLDVSGSTYSTRTEEILAARTFLENVTDVTEVGIFGFTDQLMLFQDFTTNRAAALQAFSSARRHMGLTTIYDSLNSLIRRISERGRPSDQRVVIVISDGLDNNYRRVQQSIALARMSGVVIYTILVPSSTQLYLGPAIEKLRSLSVDPEIPELEQKLVAFDRVARETGGRHFSGLEAILDFDQALAQINDDVFGNLYTLGYHSDDPYRDKDDRNIVVSTSHSSLRVSEIFKDVPERLQTKKRLIAALYDNQALSEVPEHLYSTFREIGVELDILSPRFERGGSGLSFRLKVNPFSLRGDDREGVRTQLGVIGLLLDENGNEVVRLREFFRVNLAPREIRDGRGIIYNNRLLAPPGVYELRLALLEVATWRMTAFEKRVRISEN